MPAPVSKTVLSFGLSCCCGVDARNSVRAAIAPETEAATEGMMVGAGKGAVYGIRINCPPILRSLPSAVLPHATTSAKLHLYWEAFNMLFEIGLD